MKWEYKLVEVLTKGLAALSLRDKNLNLEELGNEGWELVTTLPLGAGFGTTSKVIFIFKRSKAELNTSS